MASYKVIIDQTRVAADLVDFPVYINLADMPSSFWDIAANGGGDIRCYDVNDNELAREVVSCDTALQSGELHLKANLSSTVPTILKVTVDGVSSDYVPTDTYGRNAVWSDYGHVWHFTDRSDSTGSGVVLTGLTPNIVNGVIGQAMNITRVEQGGFSTGLNNVFGSGHWTVGGWINPSQSEPWQCLVNLYHSDALMIQTTGSNQPGVYDGSMHAYNVPVAFSSWAHFCWTRDSNNGTADTLFYLNGTYIGSVSSSLVLRLNYIGDGFGGSLDNLTVTEQVRSPAWISTEYNNQSSTSTFYTIDNLAQSSIPHSEGYAYSYVNTGFGAPNTGTGYAYSYVNTGFGALNSGSGYSYSYVNTGCFTANSDAAYAYSYENNTIYVVVNANMLPPMIN